MINSGGYNPREKKIIEDLNRNFGEEANAIWGNPYYQEYVKSGYEGAIAKAAGTTDPNVIKQIYAYYKSTDNPNKRIDQFLSNVAASPENYSKTLLENNIATTGLTRSKPQIENLTTSLLENQKLAEERANRALATRGISVSGAVGAAQQDLSDKYAKALAGGTNEIISANTADVANKMYGEYDTAVGQRYTEKIANEQQKAFAAAQKEPTIFDWIGGILGLGNQAKNLVTNPYEELLKKQNTIPGAK